ncbi:MAG: hypothetical protein ABIR35_02970 [Polaromonas sp.]
MISVNNLFDRHDIGSLHRLSGELFGPVCGRKRLYRYRPARFAGIAADLAGFKAKYA